MPARLEIIPANRARSRYTRWTTARRYRSRAGNTDAMDLLERYPHATLAAVVDAGHALMHERPELLAAFLSDWLGRVRPEDE